MFVNIITNDSRVKCKPQCQSLHIIERHEVSNKMNTG